jgi:hypothetical protein
MMIPKAESGDFFGRFREIVSDPLNLLIERHPSAGLIEDGLVTLHNGHKVAVSGPAAYYGAFSNILIINRGVHEPLEEFVFQTLMRTMPEKPMMIELGAYWAHYSMWLKQQRPRARVVMVEPEAVNIEAGKANFVRHGYVGEFVQAFVGDGQFEVDDYLAKNDVKHLDILHSDIQGFEVQMLKGARNLIATQAVDYIFISTHSQALHATVKSALARHGYRIEADADVEEQTTSYDGLIFASSPKVAPVLPGFKPLGRQEICNASAEDLASVVQWRSVADKTQAIA